MMVKEKVKIMTYGDNQKMSSGYGCAWDNLLKRWAVLRPNWDFYHVGWQTHDREHSVAIDDYKITEEDVGKEVNEIPSVTRLPIKNTQFGFDVVAPYAIKYKPDIILTQADVGWQGGFRDGTMHAKKNGWMGSWLAYTPIDTHSWEYVFWDKIFEVPEVNIAMAKHGAEMMEKHKVPNIKYIPLGVDLETYRPLKERDLVREKMGLSDKFVVGFVGKNQIRKMLASLLKGFAQFSKGKEDVRLLLHTAVEANGGPGWNLSALQEKFAAMYDKGLSGTPPKMMLTIDNLHKKEGQHVTPEKLNEFYNMMDVFCYASGGEGFGIPGMEAQAAGVPLMMTDYTTGPEFTNNGEHGWLIPRLKDVHGRDCVNIGNNGIENVYPDDVAIKQLLENAYQDWKKGGADLKKKGKQARTFAEQYNWDRIAAEWITLFEDQL